MSTDEYVPSDARMREQYIWAHAREAEGVAEQSYGIQVCSEAWDAWLTAHDARVRRDAAREALDGLIADTAIDVRLGTEGNDPKRVQDAEAVMDAAHIYRITEYPEETP